MLVAKSVTIQVSDGINKEFSSILNKEVPMPPEAEYVYSYKKIRYFTLAGTVEMWLCYWLVKLTFIIFYRQLFDVSKRFRTLWWITLAFTLLTFWVPIAGELTFCGGSVLYVSSWGETRVSADEESDSIED